MRLFITRIGLLIAALSVTASLAQADWIDGKMPVKQEDAVAPTAAPAPLENVRLTPSIFADVQNLEKAYLLSLEPDRFLVRFRSEAGLPAKPGTQVYGGWEKNTPLAGHSFGHFLTAASKMYAATGDEQLKASVDKSVEGLAQVQKAFGADPRWEGYVAAIPNGKDLFEKTAAGDVTLMGKTWIVPYYTQHKILAGLLDAYRYCGNKLALEVAKKHVDWLIRFLDPLTPEQFERMLHTEFGGIQTPILELYSITGEKKYLDFALRFEHKEVVTSWKAQRDNLPGIHANTQVPKAQGCAKAYEITGDKTMKTAADFFWNTVVKHHTYVTGGNSSREHFGPEDKLNDRFADPTETCNTYNMLKLTEHLFAWNPNEPQYMDYYERALYNHILGAINHHASPDNWFQSGLTCYFIHFKPGSARFYEAPYDAFTCCFGTGMENPGKYGCAIYWKTPDNKTLYVNLFIPSVYTWEEQGVKAEIKTNYPASGKVEIAFTAQQDAQFDCKVRIPSWTGKSGFETFPVALKAGESKSVTVNFPMTLRTESMPDNPNRIAIFYGPALLTADLGDLAQTPVVPAIVSSSTDPADWLKSDFSDSQQNDESLKDGNDIAPSRNSQLATRNSIRFTAKPGAFTSDDLTFVPFYALHERRNCIFFDRMTPEQAQAFKQEAQRREQAEKELKARTLDYVAPGEMQSERDHNVQSENSEAGTHNGRKYRHASGWFSYDVAVNPTLQNEIQLDFWGGDVRKFTMELDGKEIAVIELNNDKPGQFFTRSFDVPQELTAGKTKATLKFVASSRSLAGGVFGIRVLKK